MSLVTQAYDSNLLVKDTHDLLVANVERYARRANIPVSMVFTSMQQYCTEPEIEYMKDLRRQGNCGLIYSGEGKAGNQPVHDRMMSIAGACLRNFINAKVMTVQSVLKALKHDSMPEITVLLIPNFYHKTNNGGVIPTWEVSNLLGLLYSRQEADLKTFLYVQDLVSLRLDYGNVFESHLKNNFSFIEA